MCENGCESLEDDFDHAFGIEASAVLHDACSRPFFAFEQSRLDESCDGFVRRFDVDSEFLREGERIRQSVGVDSVRDSPFQLLRDMRLLVFHELRLSESFISISEKIAHVFGKTRDEKPFRR